MISFEKIGSTYLRILTALPRSITFLLVYCIFFAVSYLYLDPDFGWHLAAGNYFRVYGIPLHDIFSYTASYFPWIDHEWLSDIFVSLMYSMGGYILLVLIYAGLWTAALWLVARRAYSFVVILAALSIAPFAGVRAITWSVVALALLITILNAKDKRWRLVLPLLFLVWTNIHGSFVIGFAYGLIIAVWERSWRLMGVGLISALMTLINPYGITLYVEILRTLFDSSLRTQVREWRSFYLPWSTVPYVILWAATLVIASGKRWRMYLKADTLFFGAALSSVRNVPLFTIVSVGQVQDRLETIATRFPKTINQQKWRFVVILLVIGTAASLIAASTTYRTHSLNREANYPTQSVKYLSNHPCSGRIFNYYDFGGYLIWKLPSAKVFIDGRMPSWKHDGDKYMNEYLRVLHDTTYRGEQFKAYDIRCVVVKRSEKRFIEELKNQNWQVVVNEPSATLLLAPVSK